MGKLYNNKQHHWFFGQRSIGIVQLKNCRNEQFQQEMETQTKHL